MEKPDIFWKNTEHFLRTMHWASVADPDPVLFYPPDPGWSNGRIRDKQTKFVNSLYTKTGRIRDPVLFYTPDPGSGMEQWSDPDPG
jgi:hypothetical protein